MTPILHLASTSPRRRELLRRLGLRFRLIEPKADETAVLRSNPSLSPRRFAIACARAKALSAADDVREGLIIGVDTVVVLNGRVMGKPRDRAEARRMLTALSGRVHRVVSGVAIARMPDRRIRSAAEATRVAFRQLEPDEIERYIATREPYDKAGAYGIQEQAAVFVERVEGCYTNVIGLPVRLVLDLLAESGSPVNV